MWMHPWSRPSRWGPPSMCLQPTIAPFEGQPPVGRFAFLGDPQGAVFGIFQSIT